MAGPKTAARRAESPSAGTELAAPRSPAPSRRATWSHPVASRNSIISIATGLSRWANSGSSRPWAERHDPMATPTAARAAHSSPMIASSRSSNGTIRS